MKTHPLIPCLSTVPNASPPGAATRPRPRHRARLARLWAALLLCLGCLLLPFGAGAAPVPRVALQNVPGEVLIGEEFTFQVLFWNNGVANDPMDIGYGPFIDLVLDGGGADLGAAGGPCDGLTLVSATLLTGGGSPLPVLNSPSACPAAVGAPVPVPHPFAASGPPLTPVLVERGAALHTLTLPFGHYERTQPDLVIEVRARVSDHADPYDPFRPETLLRLCARSGFRYGADPLDNGASGDLPVLSAVNDSALWTDCAAVRPTVMTLSKGYCGPEGEAATGPNFLSVYPLKYQVTVNIAAGQTINQLFVKDMLPPTLVYQNNVTVTIGGVTAAGGVCGGAGIKYELTQAPFTTAPQNGSVLEIKFCNPILGTTAPDEVVVTFQFYISEFDADGDPILGPGCAAGITNLLQATGQWIPADPRDPNPTPVVAGPVTNVFTAKCLAVQKTVSIFQDNNPAYPGPTPGDILKYEINFQISDYKTLGNLVLTDCLSGNQYLEWNSAPFPHLTVNDQFGTVQADFDNSNYGSAWTVDLDETCVCCPPLGPTLLGASRFTFDISQLMIDQAPTHPRHDAGLLTGGHASAPHSTTPATGTLVFYARIRDELIPPNHYPGDIYVDKHDPLLNCVVLEGELHQNADAPALPPPTGVTTTDDSKAGLSIIGAPFRQTIYAVNGVLTTANSPNPPCLGPGDTVTFRLTKPFPTGDAESVSVFVWPPLPALKVHDPTAINNASWTWLTPTVVSVVPPPSGSISYLPTDTLHLNVNPALPTVTASLITSGSGGDNSLRFDYGSFNNPANSPWQMDLLFTMTVQNDPMADGLFLNNQTMECEQNTLLETFCEVSLAQIKIAEPNLKITKGIVASDNPKSDFSQTGLGPITFTAPGNTACERFSGGVINSTTLPGLPGLNSDLSCADAGDRVTFAIIVQNLGSGPDGAFDIFIKETLPPCLINPGNVCVTDGAGTPIPTAGNLFGSFQLIDSVGLGALAAADSTSGKDIAVITFDATYAPGFQPQCCTNQVALTNYSNVEGGANFVAAGLGGPFADEAQICSQPKVVRKCIITTSEAHTTLPAMAVAEIVRYRLLVVIPEGSTSPGFNVKDILPAGLAYSGNPRVWFVSDSGVVNLFGIPSVQGNEDTVNCDNATPPPGVPFPSSHITITPSGGGSAVVFDFKPGGGNPGGFQNLDNDPDCEFLIIDFNALVLNVAGNQAGTVLPNQFGLFDGATLIGALSPPVTVTVFEPAIDVTKQVTVKPQQINDPVTYTVTFVNSGPFAATAFDVRVRDVMPGCLGQLNFNLITVKDAATGIALVFANNSSSSALDLTLGSVQVNQTVVVTYTARYLCGDCDRLTNTVNVTWTSLPGPNGTCGNPTGQCTPNLPGSAVGERIGSGSGVNDYVDSASANLCPDLAVTKTAMGSFMAGLNGTYMITVTNNGCGPAFPPVTVIDTVPAGLTPVSAAGNGWQCSISGQTITCIYTGPPILAGGSFPPITISVAIAPGLGGFTLSNCAIVQSDNDNNPSNNESCVSVAVLTNKCLAISNEVITCTNGGVYLFSFDLYNLSDFPASSVSFAAESPFGVTITPDPFPLSPPLNRGDPPRRVTIIISGPGCGKVCFLLSIHDELGVNCCTPNTAVSKCIVLPECDCVPAPTRMVAWLRGDNNALDSSDLPIPNHGTLVGGASYGPGVVGPAFQVTAAGDYVNVPHPNNGSLDFSTVSFSIDAWIWTTNDSIATIVDKRTGTISAPVGYVFFVNFGRLGFQLNGVNYVDPAPGQLVNDGQWYHVTAVANRDVSPQKVLLYVNGTEVHNANISGNPSVDNTGDLWIGEQHIIPGLPFRGAIDEVEIFRRALRPDEIKSLWQAGCAGKCKCFQPPLNMVNWWRFDEVGGTVADDLATPFTYNNAGTHNGTHEPGKVNFALCFDGVSQQMVVPNHVQVNFAGSCPDTGAKLESFTIDAWIKTDQSAGTATILDKRRGFGPFGLFPRGYMLSLDGGKLSVTLADGVNHPYTDPSTGGPNLLDNQWHFIAVTYQRCLGELKLYVDDTYIPVATFYTGSLGSIVNTSALFIGRRSFGPPQHLFRYRGCIDELEFFKRVLSAEELYSIWNAGVAGKCRPPFEDFQGPVHQSVQAGSNAVFTVVNLGETPLNYQWLFNGTPVADATNDTLTVLNAQPAHAGAYAVIVSNESGSVTSRLATLTVVGVDSYTMTLLRGDNLIANQLNRGGNTLAEVLPQVPVGTTLRRHDGSGYTVLRFGTGGNGGWDDPAATLPPGEGAILNNPSDTPFTITFTGNPVTPSLPLALRTGFNLVSRQDLGEGTFANIVGLPPTEGTVFYRFNPAYGVNAADLEDEGYISCLFLEGAWDCEPATRPGEAAWIYVPDTTSPVLASAGANCESNKVTVVFNEPVAAATATVSSNYSLNGASIAGAVIQADGRTVCLSTPPLQSGTSYTLTVNNVSDLAGNVIAPNSSITFSCATNNPLLPPLTVVAGVVPGGMLKFEWSGYGILQAADNLAGSSTVWTDVTNASSGYMVNPQATARKFYRLRYP